MNVNVAGFESAILLRKKSVTYLSLELFEILQNSRRATSDLDIIVVIFIVEMVRFRAFWEAIVSLNVLFICHHVKIKKPEVRFIIKNECKTPSVKNIFYGKMESSFFIIMRRCSSGDFYSLASLINLVDYSDIHVLFLINIQWVYSFSKIITKV